MKTSRWIVGALVVVLLATAAGLWSTRDRGPNAPPEPKEAGQRGRPATSAAPPARQRLIDMRPLLTARRVAGLAATPEEQELAREAERLADHSVDLAFADAMRQAADEKPAPTPQLRELLAKRSSARAAVDAGQRRIRELEAQAAAARGADERDRLQQATEVARAQLELERDELNDAADAVERAGGDPQAKIRRLREAYEAAQKEPRPAPAAPAPAAKGDASLLARVRAWMEQRSTVDQLRQAREEAREKADRLAGWRGRLSQQLEAAPAADGARRPGEVAGDTQGGAPDAAKAAARQSAQRRLAVIEQRIHNQQDLGEVYDDWSALAQARARALLHRVLVGVFWILLSLSLVYAAFRAVDALLHRAQVGDGTLRMVAKVAFQFVGVVVIVFMAFGVPAQATTIIGLAGAGLTVAMKDFIVAFFGWFVLVGRHGIRVGDWVEIKGVGGEVAEIGILHTVLLETGSWSDAGHPTGRRVSFNNSFAIEGHYFNFSTSGQWMWDELRVLIPLGQDPYPVIDGVQRLAQEETRETAKLAEQEWAKATTRYRVRSFSAAPGVNVIPTSAGVEVDVRYITRAFERHETRRRLYHAVVELMHGKRAAGEVIDAA